MVREVCGGEERFRGERSSLPTHCPGSRLSETELILVSDRRMDIRFGKRIYAQEYALRRGA